MPDTRSTTLFSLASLKAWLKIDTSDESQDERLIYAADGATAEIEREIDVPFVQRSITETFSGDGKGAHPLANNPIASIDSFTIDGSPVSSANYILNTETGVITFTSGGFTCGLMNVVITYTAGYDKQDGAALPADIYRAGLDLTKAIYDELAAGAIAATSVSLGASTMVIKAAKRPPSVQRVIDNWAGVGMRA